MPNPNLAHECDFPRNPGRSEVFNCLECGTIWMWSMLDDIWESIGEWEPVLEGEI